MERDNMIARIALILETLDAKSLRLVYCFALKIKERERRNKR